MEPESDGSVCNPADTHRLLEKTYDLNSILTYVDTREVTSDYTIRFQGKIYQIARRDMRTELRGGMVRVEVWLDGSVLAAFMKSI